MESMPIRPAFWNIPFWAEIGVYVVGLIAAVACIIGICQCIRLWRAGRPQNLPDQKKDRWLGVWRDAFMHRRLLKTPSGLIHFFIFWGFVFLFFGTATAVLDWDIAHYLFDARLLKGNLYLAYKFILDLAGLLTLIGLAVAAWRRFAAKGKKLERSWRFAWILTSLAIIVLTGFVVEGLRLAAQQPEWAIYSPVGYAFSLVFLKMFTPDQLQGHTLPGGWFMGPGL